MLLEILYAFDSPVTSISNGKMFSTLLPQQEEGRFSASPATAQPMRDCYNPANEKPLRINRPVSSSGLFVYNSSSQLSLSSVKEHFLPFFSRIAYSIA